MPKAKIRHLALYARDPEKLSAFYQDVFGMELILSLIHIFPEPRA